MTATNEVKQAESTAVGPARPATRFRALADVYETLTAYGVDISLPGVHDSDLVVSVENRVLSVTAPVAVDAPEAHRVLYRGYTGGEFTRAFRLPDEVDPGGIKAQLKHGILHIELPKKADARPRRIELNVAG